MVILNEYKKIIEDYRDNFIHKENTILYSNNVSESETTCVGIAFSDKELAVYSFEKLKAKLLSDEVVEKVAESLFIEYPNLMTKDEIKKIIYSSFVLSYGKIEGFVTVQIEVADKLNLLHDHKFSFISGNLIVLSWWSQAQLTLVLVSSIFLCCFMLKIIFLDLITLSSGRKKMSLIFEA